MAKGEVKVILGLNAKKFERGLKKATRTVTGFAKKLTKIGTLGGAISFGVLSFAVIKTSRSFAEFEKGLAKVSTMLDARMMPMMDEFTKDVRKLSLEFGQATDTISGGLFDILSAQIKAAGATEVLTAATKLATAGFTDVKIAGEAMIRVLSAYNLTTNKATAVSDKLFKIMELGVITFDQLAPKIGMVAGLAGELGVNFNELGAALAMATRILPIRQATTSIRAMLNAFLNATPQAIAMGRKFGVEISALGLRKLGLIEISKRFSKATSDELGVMFNNKRALLGVMVSIAKTNLFYETYIKMLKSTGATERALQKVQDKTFVQLGRVRQAFKYLLDMVGKFAVSTGIFEKIRKAITFIADGIDRLITSGQLESFRKKISDIADDAIRMGKAVAGMLAIAFGGGNTAGRRAAENFMINFGNMVIAVFKTAAVAAVEVLLMAASAIGKLIGKGLWRYAFGDKAAQRARSRAEEEVRSKRPRFDMIQMGTGQLGSRGPEKPFTADEQADIETRTKELLKEFRLREGRDELAQLDFGIGLDEAFVNLKESANEMAAIIDGLVSTDGGKPGRPGTGGRVPWRGYGEGDEVAGGIAGALGRSGGMGGLQADQLRRIGGTLGGFGGVAAGIQQKQLTSLEKIAGILHSRLPKRILGPATGIPVWNT